MYARVHRRCRYTRPGPARLPTRARCDEEWRPPHPTLRPAACPRRQGMGLRGGQWCGTAWLDAVRERPRATGGGQKAWRLQCAPASDAEDRDGGGAGDRKRVREVRGVAGRVGSRLGAAQHGASLGGGARRVLRHARAAITTSAFQVSIANSSCSPGALPRATVVAPRRCRYPVRTAASPVRSGCG